TIKASGAQAVFDILQDGGTEPGLQHLPTSLWSDAGSITISVPNLLYDGTFVAQPAAAAANGGSLTLLQVPQAKTMLTVQQGGQVAAGLGPTDTAPTGFVFQADHLTNSGIASLTLASGFTLGDDISAAGLGHFTPGPIQFSGNVTIAGLNMLALDA